LVEQGEQAGGVLQLLPRRLSSHVVRTPALGVSVKTTILFAALLAAAAQQPVWAASKSSANCYTPNAIEAEPALRCRSQHMVASYIPRRRDAGAATPSSAAARPPQGRLVKSPRSPVSEYFGPRDNPRNPAAEEPYVRRYPAENRNQPDSDFCGNSRPVAAECT